MKTLISVVCLFIVFFAFACNHAFEPDPKVIDFSSIGNSPKPGLIDSINIPVSKLKAFSTDQKNLMAITWEEIDAFSRYDFNHDPVFHTENFKAPTHEEILQSMACGLNCGQVTYVITGIPQGSSCHFANYCCTISNSSFGSRSVCCDQ